MRTRSLTSLLLVSALLATGCYATASTSTTWGSPYGERWARDGRVESVRETVRRLQGDPGSGAVAGAIVGGLLGSAVGGRTHYDRYGRAHHHGSGAGAVAGAIGGAVVGAAASQGSAEERVYEVFVRFDDGGYETFVYRDALPFGIGDEVRLTSRGLERI
jgi:outer membrane lipoprotein SlyB